MIATECFAYANTRYVYLCATMHAITVDSCYLRILYLLIFLLTEIYFLGQVILMALSWSFTDMHKVVKNWIAKCKFPAEVKQNDTLSFYFISPMVTSVLFVIYLVLHLRCFFFSLTFLCLLLKAFAVQNDSPSVDLKHCLVFLKRLLYILWRKYVC